MNEKALFQAQPILAEVAIEGKRASVAALWQGSVSGWPADLGGEQPLEFRQ